MKNNSTYKIRIIIGIIGILLVMFVGFAEAAPSIPANFVINATNSTANISWDESTGSSVVYTWVLVNSSGYENITHTVRNESMVLYTHFNDGTSTDWSLYGNNGTDTNISYVSEDKYGYAAEFNGIDSYINCGNDSALDITDAITIEAMIYVTNNTDSYILAKGSSYRLKLEGGTKIRTPLYIGGSLKNSYSPLASIGTDTLYHVVTTYDKNDGTDVIYVYLNGVDVSVSQDDTGGGAIDTVANDFEIGKLSAGYYFDGTIDDVRIYNRALSPVEINANSNIITESASYDNFTGVISNLSYGDYHIIVNARDNLSYSAWSQVYNFTIPPLEPTPTPTPLLVSNITSNSHKNYINWTWQSIVPALIYIDGVQSTDIEIENNQYIANGLNPDSEHIITIRANNSSTYEYFYDTAKTQTELSLIDFSTEGIILFVFVAFLPLLNKYTQERWLFKIPLFSYLFYIIIESANNYENINAFVLVFCAVMMILYIFVDYIKEFKP